MIPLQSPCPTTGDYTGISLVQIQFLVGFKADFVLQTSPDKTQMYPFNTWSKNKSFLPCTVVSQLSKTVFCCPYRYKLLLISVHISLQHWGQKYFINRKIGFWSETHWTVSACCNVQMKDFWKSLQVDRWYRRKVPADFLVLPFSWRTKVICRVRRDNY